MPSVRAFGQQVGHYFFPVHCVVTGRVGPFAEGFRYLSPEGVAAIPWYGGEEGRWRGQPFSDSQDKASVEKTYFYEGRCLWAYQEWGKLLIQQYKYHEARFLEEDFAALVRRAEGLAEYVAGALLVPVPLHGKKMRQRGFDQSMRIAEMIAALSPTCRVWPALQRVRHTSAQVGLSRKQRQKNVKNAFAMRPDFDLQSNFKIILIDDVVTTGSTIEACARVLREAGADRVDFVALAHG